MTLRLAEHHAAGTRTFYVGSESQSGTEYCVQYIRKSGMRRWQCNCPQFYFRCAAKRRQCKHIHFVRHGAKETAAAA
jgi:hypothetical protein